MQVIKPMALGITTRCIEFKRRFGLVVTASLFFPFRPAGEGELWTEPSMWKFLGEQMPEGPFIDECGLKPQSEYLLRAFAHPPGGPAPACEVVAQVGGLEKRLHAVGPRRWAGRTATVPEPFDALPLDWRHAYGGPGYARNPLGIGHAPMADGSGALQHRLPQVVLPQQHPGTPTDEVTPASFGPIDVSWPQRSQYAGTYDERWMKEQMPGFASDLDWRYFNMAPEDQRFAAPPRGDEHFSFQHMHPTKPVVGGTLPALVARCMVDHGDGIEPRLREVALKLATLWFFPHSECGVMLFQGLAECGEDDAADIHTLLGSVERLGEPRTIDHYLDALLRRRHPTDGALHALRESDLLPNGWRNQDPAFAAMQADYQPEGLGAQAQRRGAVLKMQVAIDEARAKGVDPAKLGLRIPQPERVPSLDELPEYLIRKRKEVLNAQVSAMLDAAEQMQAARAKAAAAGIDPAALVHRGPPTYRAADHLAQLQALVAKVPGARLPVDVATLRTRLTQVESLARTSYLATAHAQPPAPRLVGAQAASLRDQVVQGHREGKSFFAVDLTGAELSGLDLSGADFTHAWLESANLSGAILQGCCFEGAVLAHADLTGADLTAARLAHANLGRATLKTTRLVKADLTGAVLNDTALAQTDLRGACITNVQLIGATFGLADWRSVHGAGVTFHKAQLKDMVFHRCQLKQPVFLECDLTGADFAASELEQPTFLKCTAVGTRFSHARMARSVFVDGCDFSAAGFAQADLSGANLRATRLAGSDFQGARLDGADLSNADASSAKLDHASLKGALLVRTTLSQASLSGAQLMNAIVQRADLRGANLSGANLYGADLSRILSDAGLRLQLANLDRAKTYPRRDRPAGATS